jgi:molecular chaperone DnaK (HSP70)
VITAPVHFTDNERSVLFNAATQAGWNVLRIVSEPTAAALAYATEMETVPIQTETVLVIDSGGGTTDFSVVELDYLDKLYIVKDTLGEQIGGKDLTRLLVDYVIKKYKIATHPNTY